MISPHVPARSAERSIPLRGRLARLSRLALKELRETLRDRRTLITLILMPVLVYPLLGVILQKVLLSAVTGPAEVSYALGFCSDRDAARFQELYRRGNELLPENTPQPRLDPFAPDTFAPDCNVAKLVSDKAVDLGIAFVKDPSDPDGPERIELVYHVGNQPSQTALLAVEQRLHALKDDYTNRALKQHAPSVPRAGDVVVTPIQATATPSFSLATFVPLMLILMTVTGAVYPAIDLTAGERERGTLEVLVAAPVPRIELLKAKFIAVLTVAMLTAVVNLVAMLITVYASGLEGLVFGSLGFSGLILIQILGLLFLFAAFFSAVLLAITSFARSFKEAQAYLIPLMLVALAPGIFSLTPGLKMNGLLAVTPLVNIVLLGRDLLEGRLDLLLFAGTVASTVLYAILALTLAARVFGSDAILYGSQGSMSDLFRRPKQISAHPSLTQAMFSLAVLFPAFIILGSLPGRFADVPMSWRLGLSGVVTVLLFAGWPAAMNWRNNVRARSAFRLNKPPAWSWAVAVLWGFSLWMGAYELEILTLSENRVSVLKDLFETLKLELNQIPLAWRLLTLAVVPAVCEELFFRGYLLSGLKPRMSPASAVVLSAVLFGLFHVMVRDVLFFERFLPSTFLGIMLGWLAVRTGSTWPGMLLHVSHNGLLLTLAAYQAELTAWGIGSELHSHLPWPWLAGSGTAVLIGAILLLRLPRAANET